MGAWDITWSESERVIFSDPSGVEIHRDYTPCMGGSGNRRPTRQKKHEALPLRSASCLQLLADQ
jgi:hypothetical protein